MIAIINGPNLNLLGKREPEVYGSRSFEDYLEELRGSYPQLAISCMQSNCEGEIVDAIQKFGFDPFIRGIVINPGAHAHYSYAIADAISAVPAMVVEVHISNIFAREEFRHRSVTAPRCAGVVTGFGLKGYELALRYILEETHERRD